MYPSNRRRLGRWKVLVFAPLALLLILDRDSCAQQTLDNSTLQTPQVFRFNPPPVPALVEAAPTSQIDPASLLRIPVTVVDKAGQCVPSLRAGDFSLDVDGQESPIKLFRPNRATAAALGVLVDISQSMSFKSWHGGMISKLPFIQDAVHKVIDLLDVHDNVFLATFARRFHMLDDFTSDHDALDERLPMLRVTDQLDDFGGSGIYESLMKGIAVLNHAPKTCDRRALVVFTDGGDTSTHGVDDVIARAQFASVTIYDIIVQGYSHEMDALAIRDGIGRIAAETGGLTFIVNGGRESDPIGVATEEIVAELDNQYLLGFPAPQNGASGNVLPVELMLRNHPGLLVRAPRAVRFRSEEFIRKALAQASTLPE
jgi:VWFA-related protein